MSPRMGRPLKGSTPKNVSLQLRISEETSEKLKKCSELLNISRTEVIEKGVELIYENAVKKK